MSDEPVKKKTGFDLEWIFSFFILFGGIYLLTQPAKNIQVKIFRISVIAIGVIGLLVTTLIKRKRAKSSSK